MKYLTSCLHPWLFSAFLVLSVAIKPTPALAWNDFGHMAVAAIAYKNLKPETRSRVDALVSLNPYYSRWLASCPADCSPTSRKQIAFMLAATWPDAIKGDSEYKPDGLDYGFRPDGVTSSLNVGYDDKLLHKYWHFVDYPFSRDGTALPAVPTPNAETQIEVCRKALASDSSTASDALKSYDLNWLLHLVGDVHQPLHCVTRVTGEFPSGDSGGNFVKIYECDPPLLLHSFWDEALNSSRDPFDVVKYVDELKVVRMAGRKSRPVSAGKAASDLNARRWIDESVDLAHKKVYTTPVGSSCRVEKLTAAYRKTARQLAEKRVILAGVRLGNILNRELR
jgi:hypothetical protein